MSWITLAETDLQDGLTGAEYSALRTAALADDNPLPDILAQVVSEVRGYVAACRNNTLGDGATIPSELKAATLAIARWRAINRLPVRSLATAAREGEKNDAMTLLRSVAACNFSVVQPTTATTDTVGSDGGVTLVKSRTQTATPSAMRGL